MRDRENGGKERERTGAERERGGREDRGCLGALIYFPLQGSRPQDGYFSSILLVILLVKKGYGLVSA